MTQTYLNQPNPHPHPNPNPKSLTRQGPLAHALAAHLALAARPRRGALYPGAHGPGRGRVSELREGAAQSTQSAGADLAVLRPYGLQKHHRAALLRSLECYTVPIYRIITLAPAKLIFGRRTGGGAGGGPGDTNEKISVFCVRYGFI